MTTSPGTSKLGIECIAGALPRNRVDNFAFGEAHGFDVDFLKEKIGIKTRPVVEPGESTATLATNAVESLLKKSGRSGADIELLVVVTQTPDHLLPNVASIIHGELELNLGCAAFDISLGCSGFVYALDTVLALMERHSWTCGVLVTAETYSRLINEDDRATSPLFGDAATATLISNRPAYTAGKFVFGSDGKRREALTALGTGATNLAAQPLHMDGRAIFNFMMSTVPKDLDTCLAANDLERGDIDCYVFHQASRFMLESLGKRIGIDQEKLMIDVEDVGNTTSSTIPLALERRVLDAPKLPMHIFISGFGVGLSWASTVLTKKEG